MARLIGGTTISGALSAFGVIFDSNGNSNNWNSVFSSWNSVSALDLNARTWVTSNSANATFTTSISSPSISANNIFGQSNETVLTDGSRSIGNGKNTITLNYLSGVFINSNTTVNGQISANQVITQVLSGNTVTLNYANGAFINSNLTIDGWVTGRARINTQSGTTYTIQPSDAGSIINSTSNIGLTAAIFGTNYPAGFQTTILQAGSAQVTLSGGSGITINQANNFFRTSKQWSAATLVFTGTSWVLLGDVSA